MGSLFLADSLNQKLFQILDDTIALMDYLRLDKNEALTIIQEDNQKIANKLQAHLIKKLTTQLVDTSYIEILCESAYTSKLSLGSLALVSIYKIERFPFAMALNTQWCTSHALSKQIALPNDITLYVDFDPIKIQKNFEDYFNGKERQEYWAVK